MGLVAIVQHDIKRVVAYSTLSQLGYMTVALGVSAYSAAIFHLMTHAFFKALLFLAAGSIIVALRHEQDMRRMGGLRKAMPVTYWTCLIGALALIGFPGFSGFYSKDMIIDAVSHSLLPGAGFAQFCVLAGVFITALYTFRLIFLVFHGSSRVPKTLCPRESPRVITVPLILLAIPSVLIGAITIEPILFNGYLSDAVFVLPGHDTVTKAQAEFGSVIAYSFHFITNPVFYLTALGVAVAWWCYIKHPVWPAIIQAQFKPLHRLLKHKFGFDRFNKNVFVRPAKQFAKKLWHTGDVFVIDKLLVNGSARLITLASGLVKQLQSGYLYHYAFAMILGLFALLVWRVFA
jgi:NADH-quinone oxidoreductase subunit L